MSPERPDPEAWRRLGIEVAGRVLRVERGRRRARSRALSPKLDLLFAMVNEVPPRSRAAPLGRDGPVPAPLAHRARARACCVPSGSAGRPRRLRSYERFICNSEFTCAHIRERLGVEAAVVAPPVEPRPPGQARRSR